VVCEVATLRPRTTQQQEASKETGGSIGIIKGEYTSTWRNSLQASESPSQRKTASPPPVLFFNNEEDGYHHHKLGG